MDAFDPLGESEPMHFISIRNIMTQYIPEKFSIYVILLFMPNLK